MKRMLVFFLLLIVLSSHLQVIFASFTEEEPLTEELLQRIEEIFQVRIDMWNALLESEETNDIMQLEEILKDYIVDPLITDEISLYEEMLNEPTFFEKIRALTIIESSQLENSIDKKKIRLKIIWELEGYSGVSTETVNYILEMRKSKELWLLADYQVVN
ncbi:hypothetical protein [Alkaliphilus transvaalensis]|uniref:hypothetical protein n=1 Tax=Alkaliphilus transvaalensis TaxID=114628 RepID=UPI00047BFD3D|nr:hypothetical protein [Alkaliphilus transvaalensis]